MIYRPIREKSVKRLKEILDKLVKNTGYDEISLSSLSTVIIVSYQSLLIIWWMNMHLIILVFHFHPLD